MCIPNAKRIRIDGKSCIIDFYSEEDKLGHISKDLIPVGPFRLHKQKKADPDNGVPRDFIELIDECDKTGIDVIRIEGMRTDEEWKELFSGKVGVVPLTSIASRGKFKDMGSVQTIVVPPSGDIGLYFNMARDPWSKVDARRMLASILDRAAIAEVACLGAPRCVIEAPPISSPDSPIALPKEVSIVAMADDSTLARAARALKYHLSTKLEMQVTVHELPLEAAIARLEKGDYDFTLLPLARPPNRAAIETTRIHLETYAHYAPPELEQATKSLDWALFESQLLEDIPALRLYANLQFAAIDKRFCYRWKPDSQTSWRWLAHVYPCNDLDSP